MAVLRIPTQLRNLSANEAEVKVEGATVAEVLQGLNTQHPGFGERLFDENGGNVVNEPGSPVVML